MANIHDLDFSPNHMHQPISQVKNYKMYKMYVIKGKQTIPIAFGAVDWSDSIDTLGIQLNFSVPVNKQDRYMRGHDKVDVGDKILFLNDKFEIFRGMVVRVDHDVYSKKITAYDYAYLLNQNKLFKQFNKTSSNNAIRDVCRTENIPVGKLSGMTAKITEIYQNQSASDIIKDIVKKNEEMRGFGFRMEIRKGKLVVEPYSNLIMTPYSKVAYGHPIFNPTLVPGSISRTDSIEDMVNKVVVTSGESESPKIIHTQSDKASQRRFGTFQEVVNVNKEETKKAKHIARRILKEKSKVGTTVSISLLGDDKIRSGRVIYIKNKTYNLSGFYLIESCKQSYKNHNRFMDLDVRWVND